MIDNLNNNVSIKEYDVLIVGCGPNGALMANMLGQYGIKTLIIEHSKTFTQIPKAAHLDDEGLRILKKVGLENEILKQSYELIVKFNKSFDSDSFTTINPDTTDLNFPRSIFWYQPHFEESIRNGFKRFNCVDLLTYHKVLSIGKYNNNININNNNNNNTNDTSTFSESSSFSSSSSSSFSSSSSSSCSSSPSSSPISSPTITTTTTTTTTIDNNNLIKILNLQNNEIKEIKSKFIIGADGGNSSIRKMMKSKLEGSSGKMRWLVVDAKLDPEHPPLPNYFQFVCNPSRPCLSLPIPPDHFRWEFVLFDDETAEQMESEETINKLLQEHMADLSKLHIVRKSVYTFQNRIANQWYDGDSIILIGDSCHMIPPFLGLGVSSGFKDCSNLSWKLNLILKSSSSSSSSSSPSPSNSMLSPQSIQKLLNTYQIERQPNIEIITEKANQAGQIIMQTNKYRAFFRNIILKTLLSIPPIERLFQNKAGMKPPNVLTNGCINSKLLESSFDNNNNNNNNGNYNKQLINHFQKIIGTQISQPFVESFNSNHHQILLLDDILSNNFALLFFNFDQSILKHSKLINKLLNNQFLVKELQFKFINVIGYNQQNNNYNNSSSSDGIKELSSISNQSDQLLQIKDNSNEQLFNFIFNCKSNNITQLSPTIAIIRPDKFIFSIYNNNNLKLSTILLTLKDSLFIN